MKKLTFCIMTSFLLLSFFPTQLKATIYRNETATASTVDNATVETNATVSANVNADNVAEADRIAESNANIARLEQIRAMDMSEMTPSEKKELREEVHMIQNEQEIIIRDHNRYDNDGPRHHRHGGGVIFIGGGTILLIILILLLL